MSSIVLPKGGTSRRRSRLWGSLFVNGTLALICLLWTIPTIGVLVSSFRDREEINSSGWWTILPHREFVQSATITLPRQTALTEPITIPDLGITISDAESCKAGIPCRTGARSDGKAAASARSRSKRAKSPQTQISRSITIKTC